MSSPPENRTVLVVDDVAANIDAIAGLLREEYRVKAATDGERALQIATSDTPPDLVLLDVMMPEMDGFEVCRRLKSDERSRTIPVVMVTALSDVDSRVTALEAGADDFLSKPVEVPELRARVRSLMQVKAYHDHMARYQRELEEAVARRTTQLLEAKRRLEESYVQTVLMGFDLFNLFDDYLGGHCRRVARYVEIVGAKLELEASQQRDVHLAAMLHDVGMVGMAHQEIVDVFSDKQVFPDTRQQQQQHPLQGVAWLARLENYSAISAIIAAHHEHADGSGYPRKIRGDEISLESQLVAVADRYDTLCRMSEFRRTPDDAMVVLSRTESSHYRDDVLQAFVAAIADADPFSVQIETNISGLTPGLVLSKPILNRLDTVLLSAGTKLNDEHIGILERYERRDDICLPVYVYQELG